MRLRDERHVSDGRRWQSQDSATRRGCSVAGTGRIARIGGGSTRHARCCGSVPDLVALLIGADGRVRTDDDLVFYNNPLSSDGAVAYQGGTGDGESLRLRCSALDADVARVIVGCAGGVLDQRGTAQLALAITDGHRNQLALARFPADEAYRGMILLEVYRRADQWRCRLLAQGYSTGLAGLVTDFGVRVEEDSTPPPAVTPPPADGYGVPFASPVTPAQQLAGQPAPSPSPSNPGVPPPSPSWAPHPPPPAPPSPEQGPVVVDCQGCGQAF